MCVNKAKIETWQKKSSFKWAIVGVTRCWQAFSRLNCSVGVFQDFKRVSISTDTLQELTSFSRFCSSWSLWTTAEVLVISTDSAFIEHRWARSQTSGSRLVPILKRNTDWLKTLQAQKGDLLECCNIADVSDFQKKGGGIVGHCFARRDLCPCGVGGGGQLYFEAQTLGFSAAWQILCQQTTSRKIDMYYDEINFRGQGFQIFPTKSPEIRTSNDTTLGCVSLQISTAECCAGRFLRLHLFFLPDCLSGATVNVVFIVFKVHWMFSQLHQSDIWRIILGQSFNYGLGCSSHPCSTLNIKDLKHQFLQHVVLVSIKASFKLSENWHRPVGFVVW